MNLSFQKLSPFYIFFLSTCVYTPGRKKGKEVAREGQLLWPFCNHYGCLSLLTIDALCPVDEGREEGLFSRCGKSKQELFRELELLESLRSCPFSDILLERKLALRLPGWDLSLQAPLSLKLPSLSLQWRCRSVTGSPESAKSWDCSHVPDI